MLIAKDIKKTYKDGNNQLDVLKGIDIEIKTNEMLLIIGPSGSGKSTLLHILGGLDKPSRGEVFLKGNSIYAQSDTKRSAIRNLSFGFIFQFYHLLNEFTAVENVMMPALIKSKSKDQKIKSRKKALELLDMVGLANRSSHRPGQLSGGEAQRVAIARALINDPELVFCDEPTGNLDYKNSESIFDILKRFNRQNGQSFVIVTHERGYSDFSDNIKYLVDGKFKNSY